MKASRQARLIRTWLPISLLFPIASCGGNTGPDYAERVEIRRTSYGVPHILAEDLGALAYGLAWAHMEDYGHLVVERLTMARGELALHRGEDAVESDFWWRRRYEHGSPGVPDPERGCS